MFKYAHCGRPPEEQGNSDAVYFLHQSKQMSQNEIVSMLEIPSRMGAFFIWNVPLKLQIQQFSILYSLYFLLRILFQARVVICCPSSQISSSSSLSQRSRRQEHFVWGKTSVSHYGKIVIEIGYHSIPYRTFPYHIRQYHSVL